MSRIRVGLLGVLAVFAVSAMSASAAFAVEKCTPSEEGGDYAVCVENPTTHAMGEYQGVLENENHSVNSVLEGEIGGAKAKLTGTTAVAKLTAGDSGASSGEIKFTGITVVKPEHCIVHEPVVAEFNDQLAAPPNAITDLFTGSETVLTETEVFTGIEFKDKPLDPTPCPIKNQTINVKGQQEATFDASISTKQQHHEVIAAFSGSKLKLGGKAAKFSGTFTEVEPSEFGGIPDPEVNWAILES